MSGDGGWHELAVDDVAKVGLGLSDSEDYCREWVTYRDVDLGCHDSCLYWLSLYQRGFGSRIQSQMLYKLEIRESGELGH